MLVLIHDMGSLRYQWDQSHTTLSVTTASGEVLGSADCAPGTSDREAAFQATDSALGRARLWVPTADGRTRARLALYNPYTGQVALGSVPDTVALSDGAPLSIPLTGLVASYVPEGLSVDGRVLATLAPEWDTVGAALAAHQS